MKFDEVYSERGYIISSDRRKTISLKDNRAVSEYRAKNIEEKVVKVYKVDGGIIQDNQKLKCDFAIYSEKNNLYLIELKGSDYSHALDQIFATIEELVERPNIEVSSTNARIVLTKVSTPQIRSSKETKLKSKLKKLNGDLHKASRIFEEVI